jgi:hypothetical protein
MMQMIWMGIAFSAATFGFSLPASALCDSTSKTCIEAKRLHQRGCARVALSGPRRDCFALGEKAYANCLMTGQWITDECNLPALGKK